MTVEPKVLALGIVEYNPIASAIADLAAKYQGMVYDVKTERGLKDAKAAAKDVAQYRIALEKKRTELKADVLERGRLIDGEAKRIQAKLSAIEDPIVDQIKAEDRRIEAQRQAAILAEQERLAREERERKEAEERRLAEERAKIEAENRRLAQERAQFEAEQRAQRERAEAEDRQRRAKLDEEERAARARRDEENRKAKEARQVEEDRLNEERERINAERRALAEAARDEQFRKDEEARSARLEEQRKREAEENARALANREQIRKEQEQLDAKEMLLTFRRRFGHLREFETIVAEIDAVLGEAAE